MSTQVRILIADDHPVFRRGLRQAIEAEPLLLVIGEASDGPTCLEAMRELQPDLCLIDINMPGLDGLAVVRQVRAQRLCSKVIFLTMYKDDEVFGAAMELDVQGYVLKDSAVADVLNAIRTVMAGHRYISPTLSDFFFTHRADVRALREQKPGLDLLTAAERRILKLIAEDKTSKEIAVALGLSPRTIENHRTNICMKLGVHGVHGLVKFAFGHKSRF